MKNRVLLIILTALLVSACLSNNKQQQNTSEQNNLNTKVWTVERVNEWYGQYPFLAGGNYVPVSAINQLEMCGAIKQSY